MVKKWIVMIVLSVLLLTGCIIESIYVNKSFDSLITSLENFQLELDKHENNIDKSVYIVKAKNIHQKWHKKVRVLKCLIWHSGIKDVEIGLARVEVYIEENDYTEASAEISALVDYLEHYSDDFSISLENIF